jgi:hypothetical protein
MYVEYKLSDVKYKVNMNNNYALNTVKYVFISHTRFLLNNSIWTLLPYCEYLQKKGTQFWSLYLHTTSDINHAKQTKSNGIHIFLPKAVQLLSPALTKSIFSGAEAEFNVSYPHESSCACLDFFVTTSIC